MELTPVQLRKFHEGLMGDAYLYFGAHPRKSGTFFRVWAGKARQVSVIGDFNGWNPEAHPLESFHEGIWEGLIPGVKPSALYKYAITGQDGRQINKADPYAFFAEKRPKSASVVFDLTGLLKKNAGKKADFQQDQSLEKPLHIYEVHLGSWRRDGEGGFMTYRELAPLLYRHLKEHSYNALEIMPVMEHPLDASWGYQTTGFYAATSRYGRPEDLHYLVSYLQKKGIRVILDWSPGHFCQDEHGLREFDGDKLYESILHPEWGTLNFDFRRGPVRSFLISNALFWLTVYGADGLRVDAVSSMLYLDYGMKQGYWVPNKHGGNENLEAIDFLRELHKQVFAIKPNALMIAEESTSWPLVTYPVHEGGLGFNYKWNMGWMNDILKYAEMEPYFRGFNHKLLTFSLFYAFTENFILPFSHDEVVHGKKSLLGKMPGNYEEKFANLRLLLAYQLTHPGKKLLFMGGEIGQFIEWDEDREIDWFLLDYPMHRGLNTFVKKANKLYLKEPALWEKDYGWEGFRWIDSDNHMQKILSFVRKSQSGETFLVVCNFSEFSQQNFRLGVPEKGIYQLVLNSDDKEFGGSGFPVEKKIKSGKEPLHHLEHSVVLQIPAWSALLYKLKLPIKKGVK